MTTYRLGALMSSRRALLKDGQPIGHFDASMEVEMCQRIVAALNELQCLSRFRRTLLDANTRAIVDRACEIMGVKP